VRSRPFVFVEGLRGGVYSTAMWTNFFIAAAGASAALAGLVFVALSVNISRIIGAEHLPSRAGAAVGMLMLILVCSMAALIPQGPAALGVEVILFSLCGWHLQIGSARSGFAARAKKYRPLWESVLNAVLGQVQVLPFVVGGALLLAGRSSGLGWVAGGCLGVFIASALNAWVLLVEILR
jgi:hypothetical protein